MAIVVFLPQVKNNQPYQFTDSSVMEQAFINTQLNNPISDLELLEELVQDTTIPSQEQTVNTNISIQDTTAKKDSTFYGIKNENLPVRGYEPTVPSKNILFAPTYKVNTIDSWQTLVLLLCVITLGLTRIFNSTRFRQVLKSFFSYKAAVEIIREERVFFHRANLFLSGIHIVTLGLLIYQISFLLSSSYQSEGFLSYLKIVAILFIVYISKYIFSKMLAFIFDEQPLASSYIFSISSYNNLLGISLIPVLLIMSFTTLNILFTLKYLVLPLFLIIFAIRLFRLFLIGNEKSISYIYIILYICSLEILPLVVLVKIFI